MISSNFTYIQSYLNLATAQIKNTAGNMANIDTPGYKTKGFDFDVEMQNALNGQESNESIKLSKIPAPYSHDVDGLISRPDGNNVSLDREGMEMAQAQLKFRTGVALLRQEINQVSDAIHSDSK